MLDRERMIHILKNVVGLKVTEKLDYDIDDFEDDDLLFAFNQHVKDALYTHLKAGWVGVKFLKVTGEERNMVCTLSQEYLPSRETEEAADKSKKRKHNPDVIAVWDRDAEGWRSFRLDSIEQVWKLEPIIVDVV